MKTYTFEISVKGYTPYFIYFYASSFQEAIWEADTCMRKVSAQWVRIRSERGHCIRVIRP